MLDEANIALKYNSVSFDSTDSGISSIKRQSEFKFFNPTSYARTKYSFKATKGEVEL